MVDAYDVIITGRVYRAARSKEEAVAEFLRCAGSQFDPDIVAILVGMIRGGAQDAFPPSQAAALPDARKAQDQ